MIPREDESSSITITRLICQLVLTIILIFLGIFIVVVSPEYSSAVSLGIGTLIGAWFGIIRHEGILRRRDKSR